MSSIIQNHFHKLVGDGARLTKFSFHIPPVNPNAGVIEAVTYSVKSARLPKISNEVVNVFHKGRPIPVKGTTKYDQTFEVTFYLSESHLVKRFFETWITLLEQRHYYYNPRKQVIKQNSIAQNITSARIEIPEFLTWYNPTVYINQHNFDGDYVTASYEIFNCFPIDVSTVNYDYSSVGQIGEITVTFAYSHFVLWSALSRNMLENPLSNEVKLIDDLLSFPEQDYPYDVERFNMFNGFNDGGDASTGMKGIFWRNIERGRWNDNLNRWNEIKINDNNNNQNRVLKIDYDQYD